MGIQPVAPPPAAAQPDAARPITPPYYPIIYVRGFAGTEGEIEDTVADPYMGFNVGSMKLRQAWTGEMERYVFESPLVRLMKDFGYHDVYAAGRDASQDGAIDPRSIVVYRYYDQVSDAFGQGQQIGMETFGRGLGELILRLRDRTCPDDAARAAFKVYLVGHSMGGLVIRCFLQNESLGGAEARSLVKKVFTYATPHNGIELSIVGNVPSFFTANSVDNFNRARMCTYLALDAGTEPVNTLNGKFDPDRFFCLIGTNARDYATAAGWSARLVGPFSHGLVRINNALVFGPTADTLATTRLAPRAFVHRSHSGQYGIVNSEEGYQNLVRFLFGDIRVDGVLEIRSLTLPAEVQAEKDGGRTVRASYHFEAVTRVRGARWDLSRRLASENSTVFRKYDELFPDQATGDTTTRPNHDRPELFTTFLRSAARIDPGRPSLGFSVDLGVLVPEYEVDGLLFLKNHYTGSYIFRDKLNLEATPPEAEGGAWTLTYGFDSQTPNLAPLPAPGQMVDGRQEFRIPVVHAAQPGIDATLVLTARAQA